MDYLGATTWSRFVVEVPKWPIFSVRTIKDLIVKWAILVISFTWPVYVTAFLARIGNPKICRNGLFSFSFSIGHLNLTTCSRIDGKRKNGPFSLFNSHNWPFWHFHKDSRSHGSLHHWNDPKWPWSKPHAVQGKNINLWSTQWYMDPWNSFWNPFLLFFP